MQLIYFAALAALLAVSTANANAERSAGHYFVLFNATHDSMTALSVAPAGSADFRPVGISTPLHGGNTATTLWLETANSGCLRDLRVEFRGGRTLVYRDINVCRHHQLRMTARDGRRQ